MEQVSGRRRTLEEVKQSLRDRLAKRGNPMRWCDPAAAAEAIEGLKGIDGESWGSHWAQIAAGFERKAEKAETIGDRKAADEAHFKAYAFYYIGRYPCPSHPKKEECARKAREQFVAASRSFDPPLEKAVIPFQGRPGEGKEIVMYLRKPKGIENPPVVVNWGGSDGFKEERYLNGNAILAAGMATLVLDSPGTGEAPVYASVDAERLFVPVFEWVKQRKDLDAGRVGVLGSSAGGYWATKVAHLHRHYLKAAVNWGGGIHYRYQPDWLEKSRYAESALLGTDEQRPRTCNLKTYEEYMAFAPKLSLLSQGILDQPCAPLLLVNGKDDKQTPIQDFYLLLEHGDPKTIRVFPGGHMGQTPQTLPTIIRWISDRLGASAGS